MIIITVKTDKKKMEYIKHWARKNQKSISFRLNIEKEKDLIAIFESIPNKADWFKDCLRNYA